MKNLTIFILVTILTVFFFACEKEDEFDPNNYGKNKDGCANIKLINNSDSTQQFLIRYNKDGENVSDVHDTSNGIGGALKSGMTRVVNICETKEHGVMNLFIRNKDFETFTKFQMGTGSIDWVIYGDNHDQ